ncbi:MAG: M24 family metallopeptidase [Proteocatella sp.]
MDKRLLQINNFLKENELDAVIFFRPDELMMAFNYLSYWGLSVGVVFENGKKILYNPALEPTDNIPCELEVKVYPWGTTSEDAFEILYNMINNDLEKYTSNDKGITAITNIGRTSLPMMNGENPPLPNDFIKKITALGFGYKNTNDKLIKLYENKTEIDLNGIRLCNQIAGIGIDTFYELLVEGNTEAEVAAAMESSIKKQIGKSGVFFSQGYAQVQSGINGASGGCFNKSTGKVLKTGELVMTEFAICVNGYWADITRTGCVGVPTEKQNELHSYIIEAQKRAIDIIKPGVDAKLLYQVAKTYLDEKNIGHLFKHALGHGVGFRYHDPCIQISENSKDLLKEGMVITIEPGIYDISFGGIRVEENVLVTKDGYEILSNFTKKLRGNNEN